MVQLLKLKIEYKLFYELRGYEKVQLMCYLHLFKASKGFLVEAFKK